MADRFFDMKRRSTAPAAVLLAAVLLATPLPTASSAAAEDSPFLPPKERQDNLEIRLQRRIDQAVAGMEERLAKAMVDALDGKARDGALPKAVEDAVTRRMASSGTAPFGTLPGMASGTAPRPLTGPAGAPRLPPLPNLSSADLVPSGATFVGCLDGRAFFQDRSGTPFLIDPRAFPAAAGGPATCAR